MPRVLKIWGPPGTGKTTQALAIVEKEVAAGVPLEWIGFISFTKAAVETAKSRITGELGTAAEMPWARTIHSLAYRLLGLSPRQNQILERPDLLAFGREFDYRFAQYAPNPDDFSDDTSALDLGDWLLGLWDYCRNVSLDNPLGALASYPGDLWHPQLTGPLTETLALFAERYQAFKEEHQKLDFVDLLILALRRQLAPSIQVLLVDEAQDLSPLQWACVTRWAARCDRLYLLGDDDQAIFSFQGGQPDLLLDYPGAEVVLDRSWRLPAAVHELAAGIITRNQRRRVKAFRPNGPGGTVSQVDWSAVPNLPFHDGTWYLISRNKKFLNRYGKDWGSNAQLPGWAWVLKDRGIPYRNPAGFDPLKPDKGLQAARCAAALGAGETVALIEFDNLIDHVPAKSAGVSYLVWGSKKRIHEFRQSTPGGLVHRSDLDQLGCSEAFFWALDNDPLDPLTLSSARKNALRELLRRHGPEVLSRPPNVTLGTIHSVKGGEAENVILDLSMGSLSYKALQTAQVEDERRIFYVGVTRAKQNLFLVPRYDEDAHGGEFPLQLPVRVGRE